MKLPKSSLQISNIFKFFGFLVILLSLVLYHLTFRIQNAEAQIPGLQKPPCGQSLDPEFQSLRPYQAAPCGDAPKAYFCSNQLVFVESFQMSNHGDCVRRLFDAGEIDFTCDPGGGIPFSRGGGWIEPHDLKVTLDDSMFPIMGNTELVQNSQNPTDQLDDAAKMSEYMSWYLSGVNGRAEYGIVNNEKIVNFSGPVKKLLPGVIQDAQRIYTIDSVTRTVKYTPEGEKKEKEEPENHNQIVACYKKEAQILPIWLTNFFGLGPVGLGHAVPVPCDGGTSIRLQDWVGAPLFDIKALAPYVIKYVPSNVAQYLLNQTIAERWSKRKPPLPWDDGTGAPGKAGKPFISNELYQKAYREWRGDLCALIPNPITGSKTLFCLSIPYITGNDYADLYQFIPLSNNTDKSGAEYILGDGPSYDAGAGTVITDAMHEDFKSAILYMAHTEEVNDLTMLLNKTYIPQGEATSSAGKKTYKPFQNKPLPETTEKLPNVPTGPMAGMPCSALVVRTNPGDDLFPGDPHEIQVIGVQYKIVQATCHERAWWDQCPDRKNGGMKDCLKHTLSCPAEITIDINTGTKTTFVDRIFENAVANSASTFRKIYPKVEEGAPVSCIADIPTVTDVTYTPEDAVQGGDWKFKVNDYPTDAAGESDQLTFPHIGSFYEYFLNGIQVALRPKGFGGTSPVNGVCSNNLVCGELPKFPKASGSCNLGSTSSRLGSVPQSLKDIVSAAAQTYKVPPNLVLGVLFGEGAFNPEKGNSTGHGYDWTDENVKKWATCERLPSCSGPTTSVVEIGSWNTLSGWIKDDLAKIDPNKKTPDPCNLVDAIYAITKNLQGNAGGSPSMTGKSCYGVVMTSTFPTSCSWQPGQYESAIRVWEIGTEYDVASNKTCLTTAGTCASGIPRGSDWTTYLCKGGDFCEKAGGAGNTSHNACIWDVAHGQ